MLKDVERLTIIQEGIELRTQREIERERLVVLWKSTR